MTAPAKPDSEHDVADPETGEVLPDVTAHVGLSPELATDLAEILEANMGGRLRLVDLPRVTMPTGGSTRWIVPGPEGDTEAGDLVGVIVGFERTRAYWSHALGDGEPFPECFSVDGEHGSNREVNPHVDGRGIPVCSACPMAEWGSMSGIRGRETRAQACREFRIVLLLQPGQLLPTVIRLAPSSIGSFHRYAATLAQSARSIRAVITRVSLERKTENGINFAVASFSKAGDLSVHDVGVARRYARAITGKIDASALLASTDQLEGAEVPF